MSSTPIEGKWVDGWSSLLVEIRIEEVRNQESQANSRKFGRKSKVARGGRLQEIPVLSRFWSLANRRNPRPPKATSSWDDADKIQSNGRLACEFIPGSRSRRLCPWRFVVGFQWMILGICRATQGKAGNGFLARMREVVDRTYILLIGGLH